MILGHKFIRRPVLPDQRLSLRVRYRRNSALYRVTLGPIMWLLTSQQLQHSLFLLKMMFPAWHQQQQHRRQQQLQHRHQHQLQHQHKQQQQHRRQHKLQHQLQPDRSIPTRVQDIVRPKALLGPELNAARLRSVAGRVHVKPRVHASESVDTSQQTSEPIIVPRFSQY